MSGRYGRWLSDADFKHALQAERAAQRTQPRTRPARICEKCGMELIDEYPLRPFPAHFLQEDGKFNMYHNVCGGKVTWQEVTWAKGNNPKEEK